MLTEGQFKASPIAIAVKRAGTGTKFVAVTFRLEDGPDKGKSVDWQGWLSPKVQDRTMQALNAMGFDGEHLASCKNEVIVVLENEESTTEDGKKHVRPRVRWVNDLNRSGGFGEELDKNELQEIMKELRGLHADSKKPVSTSFQFGHNAKGEEDDIAF